MFNSLHGVTQEFKTKPESFRWPAQRFPAREAQTPAHILDSCITSHKMISCGMMKLRACLLFLAAMVAWNAAAEQEKPLSKRPFCWVMKSPGESIESYLLGSIHVAKPEIYPLPASVEDAFLASEVIVVEADPQESQSPRLREMLIGRAMNVSGAKLEDVLSEDAYGRLVSYAKKANLKMPMLNRFKPWYVAQMITVIEMQKLGFKAEHGIEVYFLGRARGKMPMVELEGAEYQLEFLNSFSLAEQSLMLEYALLDLENIGSLVDDMMAAWLEGSPLRLEKLLHGYLEDVEGLEGVYRKLFTARNRKMAEKIEVYMTSGKRHFVVVGAGHVVGDDGIIALLRGKGIEVSQLAADESAVRAD